MVSGFTTLSPSRSAACATCEPSGFRPLPLGRSGWVITPTTSQPCASSRSDGTANSGVPMNTTRGRIGIIAMAEPAGRSRMPGSKRSRHRNIEDSQGMVH